MDFSQRKLINKLSSPRPHKDEKYKLCVKVKMLNNNTIRINKIYSQARNTTPPKPYYETPVINYIVYVEHAHNAKIYVPSST